MVTEIKDLRNQLTRSVRSTDVVLITGAEYLRMKAELTEFRLREFTPITKPSREDHLE